MTRRSWLMMGGAAAVWGASYMFIKVALDDFSEGAIVCIRTALGAVVLLTLARRWDALAPLREWLAQNVHRLGRRHLTTEMLERVVGGGLDPAPYLAYLEAKIDASAQLMS